MPVAASSRAMRLRVCPPMTVKSPPAMIFPSVCTAIARTALLAFGSNESARPVTASSRAKRLRVCAPMLVKLPPARILPSGCTAIATTPPFAFGLNAVSSVPSAFSRAMRLRVTAAPPFGASVVKSPPISILPSGCTTTTLTLPLAFGSKPSITLCACATPVKQTMIANKINRNECR